MAIQRLKITVPPELEGARLDQALAKLLPASLGVVLSKGKIRKLIIAGAVYLNTGRVRIASKVVRPGAKIEVFYDRAKMEATDAAEREKATEWRIAPADIVFEDEWIIGVCKPAGLPTQPTLDEARMNLYALLGKFLKDRDGEKAYLGLHHRLDRDTSGVMLFTKQKSANAEVGRIFREHLAKKRYLAVVEAGKNPMPREWRVDDFLRREKAKAGRMRSVKSGGDRAITDFRCLEQGSGTALVEAHPQTGRMHQIRVHLSEAGRPILGDVKYGGPGKWPDLNEIPRVLLHAASLTFPHPITKVETALSAPLPTDFKQCLRQLRLRIPSLGDSKIEPRSLGRTGPVTEN